jgi:cytoskeletal protein RodZ
VRAAASRRALPLLADSAWVAPASPNKVRFMARGNFGERLKRERELREVSPNEVVVATRISLRFLQALENEDWDKLPGGVFNRGFVRAIARYLGLDEEHLLAEYDLARGDQTAESAAAAENRIPSPPKWIAVALALGALVVIAALVTAGIYGWRRYAAHRRGKQSSALTTQWPAAETAFEVNPANSSAVLLELHSQTTPPIGSPGASGTIVLSQKT